ncbi:MAG: glucose-1-phosphate thymidylyltransferase [Thermoplasmata archaeon]
MKGVVLSGGHGTRLRPLTHTGPKQLIPIANKPNILYCLEDLRDAGITDIGIILGDIMPERVREALGNGAEWGLNLTYIDQGAPRGIAHAILCAQEFVGEDAFCVYLGDNVLKGSIQPMVEEFRQGKDDAAVLLAKVPQPERFGVVEVDPEGQVLSLVEKPKEPKSDLALVGIYLLRPNIFPVIQRLKPSWRNELEITDALDRLRAGGGSLKAHEVTGWWKDTGRAEDILEANRLILDDIEAVDDGTVERGARVEGRVRIDSGSVVRTGSVVKGPTVIGRDCVIGPDTQVGPYTSIGDGCRLVGADIEGSIVIGDSTIETPNKIVNSLIGRHTTIRAVNSVSPLGQQLIVGENSTLVL